MADRPLEIPPVPTSWILFDSDHPRWSPVSVAVQRHGVRPVAAVSDRGVAAATGSIRPPLGFWCERHRMVAAGCLYCADPSLLEQCRRVLESFELVDGRSW